MEIYLPEEIIEIILCPENVSISDVVNFSLTNKYYYDVIRNNNTLWKKKYFQIWPQLSKLFEKNDPDFCWYEELQYVYNLKRKTRKILYSMSVRFYEHYQLFGSHFSDWMALYEETPRTYYYLVHDLNNIVNIQAAINTIEVVPISTPGNKTLQYYATKVLRYLVCSRLLDESHAKLPLRQQKLETAIVFVTQWIRPNFDVSWKDVIPKKFDDWAEKVKEHLKVVHPNHPLFAVPKEELKIWREEEIDGNKYDAEDCKKVVQALESVLAITIDYEGSITVVQENNLIEELAVTDLTAVYGGDRSLLLTCQCVAKRLGLKYKIILEYVGKYPVLQLSSKFSNAKEDVSQRAESPIARGEQFELTKEIDKYNISRDMRDFTLCPGLDLPELLETLSPLKISSKMFMKECYLDWTPYSAPLFWHMIAEGIKDPYFAKTKMMKFLRVVRGCETTDKDSQKVRPANLKYAVGMVVQHVRTHYKCVIYDWDPTCSVKYQWQKSIHLLDFKNNQPFYSILDEFERHEYIAQECLEPIADTASLTMVEDIGKHFSHAFETHFVPNEAKEREYPEDAAVRHMFHQKIKTGNLNS